MRAGRVAAVAATALRRTAALAVFFAVWEVAPRAGLVDRIFLSIAVLGLVLNAVLVAVERRFTRWRPDAAR